MITWIGAGLVGPQRLRTLVSAPTSACTATEREAPSSCEPPGPHCPWPGFCRPPGALRRVASAPCLGGIRTFPWVDRGGVKAWKGRTCVQGRGWGASGPSRDQQQRGTHDGAPAASACAPTAAAMQVDDEAASPPCAHETRPDRLPSLSPGRHFAVNSGSLSLSHSDDGWVRGRRRVRHRSKSRQWDGTLSPSHPPLILCHVLASCSIHDVL